MSRVFPLVLAVAVGVWPRLSAQPGPAEVRALWVQRGTITSPAAIRSLVQRAKSAGFTALLVQVRGRADAYYKSSLEPRATALARQPETFDPLAMVLEEAHAEGLLVHAWMNANLVSDAEPPMAANHITRTKPEWLMLPRDLAPELWDVDSRSPRYLSRLSEYTRAHSDRLEGLYLSPLQPAAAEYTVNVIGDLAARYPAVDGVHLDYIRFPSAEFDYSPAAVDQFRRSLEPRLTADERRHYDSRAKGEPLFYTQMFPQRWLEFRQERLTEVVSRIRHAVKSARPQMMLSAAVIPDAAEAANHRMQPWDQWFESGLLDAICPMAYTTDPAIFRLQIQAAQRIANGKPVWAGIGAFQLASLETVLNIRAARQLGAQGVVLFSYDNLVNSQRDYLAAVGREAFGR
jgi:uncharacterized lipoprotein YddW (UPF0748 family)